MSDQSLVYKKTVCPLDCPDTCGLVAEVRDGAIVSLSGDKDHPYTRGVLCRKMRGYHNRLYAEDRILYPQKRVGGKGTGVFERISWGEAYTILAKRIRRIVELYGGEAILPFVYAGNMGAMNRFAGYPLFHKLGTSRLLETICSAAAKAGWRSHCGDVPGAPPEKAADADLILIWGSNTKVTNLHFWPYVAEAKKKGGKLVVIDPYRNMTAAAADIHLRLAPGGDSALALALMKLLKEREGLDYHFIGSCTTGFEKLASCLDATALQQCVDQCGLEEKDIIAVADLLASHRRTFIRIGIGLTRNSRAAMSVRSITSLGAALGLFDGGKGRGVLLTSGAFKGDTEKLTYPSLGKRKTRTFNMVQLGNALTIADPPVKMLFVYNSNPLSVVPDGSLVRRALTDDDLFTVVHEQVMTPTARYADLLLPATTFLENRDMYTAYGHFYMSVADPVVEPLGEAKANFTFFQELAAELGFKDPPFLQSLDDRMNDYLSSLDGLPEEKKNGVVTPGEAHLSTNHPGEKPIFSKETVPYRFIQQEFTELPDTPCLIRSEEFDNSDYLARFPFKLITPPHIDLLNSTFGEAFPDHPGTVLIHPTDALHYSIQDKDVVTLFNSRGWARRIAVITDDTQKGLLVAEGIFWQCDAHPAGVNDLTSQKLTDMGGGGTYHESRVALLNNNEIEADRKGEKV